MIGVCDDDCSVIPRILPLSYLATIKRASKDIMLFLMRLLSLPNRELLAILPPTPVTDYLIRELELLKHRKKKADRKPPLRYGDRWEAVTHESPEAV